MFVFGLLSVKLERWIFALVSSKPSSFLLKSKDM